MEKDPHHGHLAGGLPVSCTVAGEPTAFGLGPLREMAWPATSYLAEQFRAAGFIPLGRTNTAELATSATTEPRSFPPARNPWDPGHSADGSSGGSAAAVAAGLVPRICLVSQARTAVLDAPRNLVLQGADHRPGGGAGVVGCDRIDLAAQSVALVADGDPADAVRHGWGGEARD